jgi:hypothetical protein
VVDPKAVLAFLDDGLAVRVSGLSRSARTASAAAAAERLLRLERPPHADLADRAVEAAWRRVNASARASDQDLLDQLMSLGDELDHDPIAAASYALRAAVSGEVSDAVWAAQRAMDAAYERAQKPDAWRFEALEADAATPSVQEEYERQHDALVRLAADGVTPEVLAVIRSA